VPTTNPYLVAQQEKYEALRSTIEGLQARATEEKRDLLPEELRSIQEQGEAAAKLYKEISDLTEIETRNAKVAQLNATVASLTSGAQNRSTETGGEGEPIRMGGATTRDRDPGHYTRSSNHSFFGDLMRSRDRGDEAAARRLAEHARALDTTNEGPGIVAPKWLTEEFEALARQGRALAAAVRNIPLGNDPRPLTLPKQTAGTDAEVTEQSAENDANSGHEDDAWDSDVDTVTPKPTTGTQIVSRQMLDMSTPAIDVLIYGDLTEAYNLKVEKKVGAAIEAIGTAHAATEDDFWDVALDAAITVRSSRKLPANILPMTIARYGEFLKLKDGEGRPLMPAETSGPMNVIGVGTVAVDGRAHGLGVIATEGITSDATFAAVRASDVLLFESSMMRFRYEQPLGPESIKLGIWAYTAVKVRRGTTAVKKVTVA
jgi:HK97 family phage major capsid protein